MVGDAPEWFREVVATGIARLYVLRLEGAPAADTLDAVENVWCDALWHAPVAWQEAVDYRRLEAGFVALAGRITRWPAPRAVLDVLPSRPAQPRLGRPAPTPEQRSRARAVLEELRTLIRRPDGGTRS
jgi:hypothetical protein